MLSLISLICEKTRNNLKVDKVSVPKALVYFVLITLQNKDFQNNHNYTPNSIDTKNKYSQQNN